MDVDYSMNSLNSNSGDQNLIQFMIDVLTAAGHPQQFNEVKLKSASAKISTAIRLRLLPFIRCAAIYAHFMTDVKLPNRLLEQQSKNQRESKMDNNKKANSTTTSRKMTTTVSKLSSLEEYDLLCQYLGVTNGFGFLRIAYLRGVALVWARHPRIRHQFTNAANSLVRLLPENQYLIQPHHVNRMIRLPYDYSDLINSVANFTCPNSKGEESRFPTMCLICGEILCSQNYCCQKKLKRDMIGACTYHALVCGAGTGIFLRIRDCKILLLASRGRGKFLIICCFLLI